ncbi:MAG: Sec-independent protein translocase protein TatB [Proteobacteria bacterium]|nr:Sec-independent protein translocase protein TatB [Pseudomonadota bacterium]MBU1612378.1 Sec-independent protein translocase protein TatB [Pseudomonadota bacterium]
MFGIGTTELVIIIIVALIVIGPQKLPQMMRTLGKGMAEFKRMSSDVTSTLDKEVKDAERSIREQELQEKLAAEEAARKKAESVLAEQESGATAPEGDTAPASDAAAADVASDAPTESATSAETAPEMTPDVADTKAEV